MAVFDADGDWGYLAGTGGGTTSLSTGQRLLALRVFANAADGTFTMDHGGTTFPSVTVRLGTGFVWTPAAKVVATTFTFSASLDYYIEYGV